MKIKDDPKHMKGDTAIIILLVVVALLFIYNAYLLTTGFDARYLEGYYSKEGNGEGYYCVWTTGRIAPMVEDTHDHEACHSQVHRDWEHFCTSVDKIEEATK